MHPPKAVPGTITTTAGAGSDTLRSDGRIGGRELGPGSYELTAAPTADRRTGAPQTATFAITR